MKASIAERLREIMEIRGMRQTDLADATGISQAQISAYINGKYEPKSTNIAEISRACNVSESWLMGFDVPAIRIPDHLRNKRPGHIVPVYGNIAAGIPIEAITDIEDWEEIPADMAERGEYIALRIAGDSMEPCMFRGDVVIIRLQQQVESGDIAAVIINGDEATCKRVKHTNGGMVLTSFNSAYEPMYFSASQIADLPVRIIGRVAEVRRKL